jgi:hypothetical protein
MQLPMYIDLTPIIDYVKKNNRDKRFKRNSARIK